MKPETSAQQLILDRKASRRSPSESGKVGDFEHILELSRFAASLARKSLICAQYHRDNLKARGESGQRLRQLNHWHESSSFTAREKAALNLSEFLSLKYPEEEAGDIHEEARRHFDVSEMVRLTLAITAVNDWIDLHSDPAIKVLVVEDNPTDQELLRHQLQKAQLAENVIFVSDASQALDLLIGPEGEIFRRDLATIFLDIYLPGMDGIEFLQRIRIIPGMENFPVIVMTSSNHPRDIEECRRLKVASYLQKPVSFSSFSNAVANVFYATKA